MQKKQVLQTKLPGFEVIKHFSCWTQRSTKFILLINVKMPTIVGILTFISMKNATYEGLKARNFFICRYFSFYEQLKFHAQLSWAWKSFITSEPYLKIFWHKWSFDGPLPRLSSFFLICGKNDHLGAAHFGKTLKIFSCQKQLGWNDNNFS